MPQLEEEKKGKEIIRKQEHPKNKVGLKLKKNKTIDRFNIFHKETPLRDDEI